MRVLAMGFSKGLRTDRFPVAMAAGVHPFPSRTRSSVASGAPPTGRPRPEGGEEAPRGWGPGGGGTKAGAAPGGGEGGERRFCTDAAQRGWGGGPLPPPAGHRGAGGGEALGVAD